MTSQLKAQPIRMPKARLGWAFVMLWIVLLTCSVTWPLFVPRTGAAGSSATALQFLLRDMVVLPHPPLTDAALGLGNSAARATPQDTVLWALGYLFDATHVVRLLIVFAVFLGGLAAAELARTVVRAGVAGQVAAATMVIWNPFVVERFLQGHWSLVIAAMMLPCVVVATNMGRPWWRASSMALAALTPTGALLAGITGLVSARSGRDRLCVGLTTLAVSAPWLIATMVSGGTSRSSDPAGAAAFAARAENHVGTLGALMGLGGIWNKQAVPVVREAGWAPLAVIGLLVLFGFGMQRVWAAARPLVLMGAVTIVMVALFATPPGSALMGALQVYLPGAGLLRDAQKWIALAIPAYALLAAAGAHAWAAGMRAKAADAGAKAAEAGANGAEAGANGAEAGANDERAEATGMRPPSQGRAGRGRRWAAGAAAVLVIMAAVPTLPKDLAALRPTHTWSGWPLVSGVVAMSDDAVAVLPTGSYRVIDGAPVYDPATKALPAPVVASGDLIVSGQTVAGEGTTEIDAALTSADTPAQATATINLLRERGIGWVLVEDSPGYLGSAELVLAELDDVYSDDHLALYRVPGAVEDYPTAEDWQRSLVWIGIGLWTLLLVSGPVMSMVSTSRRGAPRLR